MDLYSKKSMPMWNLLLKPDHLVIIRHAESKRNAGKQGVFYTEEERQQLGNILNHDVPLTEKGTEQALEAGKKLKEQFKFFDFIIHSGYQRTIQTKDGILSAFKSVEDASGVRHVQPSHIIQDIDIRERDAGYGYLMTEKEVLQHFPWNERLWGLGDQFFMQPAGGESLANVVTRINGFFGRLQQICEGKNILLVSHGRTINMMRFLLENHSVADTKELLPDLGNAEFIHYRYNPKTKLLEKK